MYILLTYLKMFSKNILSLNYNGCLMKIENCTVLPIKWSGKNLNYEKIMHRGGIIFTTII